MLVPAWCPSETNPDMPISPEQSQALQDEFEYTQAQLLEETLGVAHDELIMLIISLVVVIQIIAGFRFLRWLRFRVLLLCSFAFLLLSAFCTVAESLFLPEVLNYIEHLSFMISAILLAVWCWYVFANKKEGV
jgi:hypothetical protein